MDVILDSCLFPVVVPTFPTIVQSTSLSALPAEYVLRNLSASLHLCFPTPQSLTGQLQQPLLLHIPFTIFPHLTAKVSFYKCKSYHVTQVLRIFRWLLAALRLESKQTPCMDHAYQSKHISYSFFSCFPRPCQPGHFRAFEQPDFSSWNVFSHSLDFRIRKQKSTYNLREVLNSLSTLYHIIAMYLFPFLFINLNIILLVFILTLFLWC